MILLVIGSLLVVRERKKNNYSQKSGVVLDFMFTKIPPKQN